MCQVGTLSGGCKTLFIEILYKNCTEVGSSKVNPAKEGVTCGHQSRVHGGPAAMKHSLKSQVRYRRGIPEREDSHMQDTSDGKEAQRQLRGRFSRW